MASTSWVSHRGGTNRPISTGQVRGKSIHSMSEYGKGPNTVQSSTQVSWKNCSAVSVNGHGRPFCGITDAE